MKLNLAGNADCIWCGMRLIRRGLPVECTDGFGPRPRSEEHIIPKDLFGKLTTDDLCKCCNEYEDQGDYAEVIPLLERSLAIREKAVGPRHPLVAQALVNLAGVLGAHGKSADALPLAERALEINEETLGADHPLTTDVLNILAPLYEERGDRQRSEEHTSELQSLRHLVCRLLLE